jgi:hypothetical protein
VRCSQERFAAWRLARARLNNVKAGCVTTLVQQKCSMGWYFNRPEVAAEQEARIRAAPDSASPPQARAEDIRRQMEDWRKRNPGQDFGREM